MSLETILAAYRVLVAVEQETVGPDTDMLAVTKRWSDAYNGLMKALAQADNTHFSVDS